MLQESAEAAEDALIENLSLACNLLETISQPRNVRTGGLSFGAAWPEGAAAKKATQKWCVENGVPKLPEDSDDSHREHNMAHKQQPGFGLVNQPIAPGSAEWQSAAGQECIQTERNKHERRGTWIFKKPLSS